MVSYSVTMLTRSQCLPQTQSPPLYKTRSQTGSLPHVEPQEVDDEETTRAARIERYLRTRRAKEQRPIQSNACSRDNITYEVNIDFDDASLEWNRNKRRDGQMYTYICGETCKTGKPCKKTPVTGEQFCSVHNQ